MNGINRMTLLGRLGRDPEIRFTPNGKPVASLSVATTRVWKDKDSGELREDTEWHRVVGYGRLAEVARDYLKKGSLAFFEGRLKTRKWDKDGVDHYATEIIVDTLQLLDKRESAAAGAVAHDSAEQDEESPI
jgi:single-strand DNA-binding protein